MFIRRSILIAFWLGNGLCAGGFATSDHGSNSNRASSRESEGPQRPDKNNTHKPGEKGASSFQYFINQTWGAKASPEGIPTVCVGQVLYKKPGGDPACVFITASHCVKDTLDKQGKTDFEVSIYGRGVGGTRPRMLAKVPPEVSKFYPAVDVALVYGNEAACGPELSMAPVHPLCPKGTEFPTTSKGYSHRLSKWVTNQLDVKTTKEARDHFGHGAVTHFDGAPGYMSGDSGTSLYKLDESGKPQCVIGVYTATFDKSRNSNTEPVAKSAGNSMLDWLNETVDALTGPRQ